MTWALSHNKSPFLKSPLNYIGGKHRLLPQILPLFPKNVDNFVDLFCGGLNVAINVGENPNIWDKGICAKQILCNDNLIYLIELYEFLQANPLQHTLENIAQIIAQYDLNFKNTQGYNALRDDYNAQKSPLKLLALIAHSFNHQIRFNNAHKFNNPFGKDRSSFNATMKQNLVRFILALQSKNITFYALDFREFLAKIPLSKESFVYADPPYLITQGTYNDGKRGFSGWNENLERDLLENLVNLHKNSIRFALSNVLTHKGNHNTILQEWVEQNGFFVVNLDVNYTNANYQTKHKDKALTQEVLITNYKI